jgi:hypothetical protein
MAKKDKNNVKIPFQYNYIEAPDSLDSIKLPPTIFLAGGITNCPDWQTDFVATLARLFNGTTNIHYTILNPRRSNFPINDPTASEAQIVWEYEALHLADIIVFWFAKGSLNPIVLFEYGSHLTRLKYLHALQWREIPNTCFSTKLQYIVVGCDSEYTRINDVIIQTQLAVGDSIHVHRNFKDFTRSASEIIYHLAVY